MLAVRDEACCAQWCSRIAQFRLHDPRGWPVNVAFGLLVIRPGTQLADERKANCARQRSLEIRHAPFCTEATLENPKTRPPNHTGVATGARLGQFRRGLARWKLGNKEWTRLCHTSARIRFHAWLAAMLPKARFPP